MIPQLAFLSLFAVSTPADLHILFSTEIQLGENLNLILNKHYTIIVKHLHDTK